MRSSGKSRSRNKNNRGRSNLGNIVNRVFDSSGPEGKVRGTPQQIIDKYQTLARDAQLAGDRVAAENFLQHSEHYSRLLGAAQREMNERREAQEAQRQAQQQANSGQQQKQKNDGQNAQPQQGGDQPDIPSDASGGDLFPAQKETSTLVDTPESGGQPAQKKQRPRKPRPPADQPKEEAASEAPASE